VDSIKILWGIAYGLIFGFTSPIPGISLGSLAIFLNIYEDFFTTISVNVIKNNLLFAISFLSGWLIGLFGFSQIIMYLYDNHGQNLFFSFIGLILGCTPMIYKKAAADKTGFKHAGIFFLAFAIMLLLAYGSGDFSTNKTIEQLGGMTPPLLIWLFSSGLISSAAMLIPGVGGSLMMLVLGIYTIYIEAVSTLDPLILLILAISTVIGVLAGIVFTRKLLETYSQTLYCAILGFIIGSLFVIYPGFSMDFEGLLSIVLAVLFAVFAYRLSKKGSSLNFTLTR